MSPTQKHGVPMFLVRLVVRLVKRSSGFALSVLLDSPILRLSVRIQVCEEGEPVQVEG